MEKFKTGDWVICGFLESHWEKYPNLNSGELKNRPEQVDQIKDYWVYLQSGMYVDNQYVRHATDKEVQDWLNYTNE